MKIMVLNGPNLNLLGVREPGIYGTVTYEGLLQRMEDYAASHGHTLICRQSNHEGDLVDWIQEARGTCDGIVINPGAYTHTSVALLDAVKAVSVPTVEVHISDVDSREPFRQVSYISYGCIRTIKGMGIEGYLEAIRTLEEREK